MCKNILQGFLYLRKFIISSMFFSELKRIISVSLSPLYEHFSETLAGLSTIRALRDTARFTEENEIKLDASQRANFAGNYCATLN